MTQTRSNLAARAVAASAYPAVWKDAALSRLADSEAPKGLFDRIGMTLSGLCLIHCVATTILVTLVSAAGGWLVDPHIHEYGLIVALGFGALALWKGIVEHGYLQPAAFGGLGLGIMAGSLSLPHGNGEMVYTMVGVALLALGHDLNIRASSRLR